MDYSISYPNKIPRKDVLGKTPKANLVKIDSFGFSSQSQLIRGDNLPILKTLSEASELAGKIRLIYIDPPYSTQRVFTSKSVWYQDDIDIEHNEHAYEDVLTGSEYLEFIRHRLIFLRELLSEDGTIYVHLDDKMAFAVKVIMDEIFGEENFRNWITRRKCSSKNYTRNQFGNITDYLMCYSKSKKPVWNRPYRSWSEAHAAKEYPRVEEKTGRRYKPVPIYAPGVRNGETGQPWRGMMPPKGKHWFTSPENLEKLDQEGRIYWSPNGNPRKKVYLDESPGVPYTDLWMNFRDAHNQNVSITGYPTEKNLDMLKMIVQASSDEGDFVLDCFAGSGTTLEAAISLNRRWIGVDSSELAINVSKNRLVEIIENYTPSLLDKYKPGFSLYKAEMVTR
jgi:adenine-specific DNA-methyltransferase